jgi:hypothetical protein
MQSSRSTTSAARTSTRDGQNYALASLLYTVGPTLLGEAAFDDLLVAFQRAVKEKTSQALDALVKAARKLNWRELPEALGPLALCSPECLSAIATPGVSTDAAMVVLQSLITRMEVMAAGPYWVEHDQSKNLLARTTNCCSATSTIRMKSNSGKRRSRASVFRSSCRP